MFAICSTQRLLLALTALNVANPVPHHWEGNGASSASSIKHDAVLVEENRSFDNICGAFSYDPSINGPLHTQYCIPVNVSDSKAGTVCAAPTAEDVALMIRRMESPGKYADLWHVPSR
jgi:phospholipase C